MGRIERLGVAGLAYRNQGGPQPTGPVMVGDILTGEICGTEQLAELLGFPGETIVGYGYGIPPARVGHHQLLAGIEATIPAPAGDKASEALLVDLPGGPVAGIGGGRRPRRQKLPGIDGRMIVTVDAILASRFFLQNACFKARLGLGDVPRGVGGVVGGWHVGRVLDLRGNGDLPVAQRVRLAAGRKGGAKQEGRQPARTGSPETIRGILMPNPFHDSPPLARFPAKPSGKYTTGILSSGRDSANIAGVLFPRTALCREPGNGNSQGRDYGGRT